MALCMILRDSSSLSSLFLWTQCGTLYSGPCEILAASFVSRYFQDGRTGISFEVVPCFMERGVFWQWLFTATELSTCIASFETTRDLETSTFLRWPLICCYAVFFCLCFVGLGIIRILSTCRTKNNNNNKVLAIKVAKFATQWLFVFLFLNLYYLPLTNLEIWLVVLFYCPFSLAGKKDAI